MDASGSDTERMISRRAAAAPPPPEHARFRNPDAIIFGGGLPDPVTCPTDVLEKIVSDLLKHNDGATYSYSYEAGDIGLRAALARHAKRDGANLNEDEVILTNGCSGALDLAALATIDSGDVVLVEELTYPAAVKQFGSLGAQIETIPLDDEGLDPDALANIAARLADGKTRIKLLYTLAGCQSPTGTILPLERRKKVVKIARRYGFLVLQDDTYGEIRYSSDHPPPFIALAPERTIHAGSFSKTLAPGLRVGWAAANLSLAQAMTRVRTDLGTTPILQRAIARMIDDDRYARHVDTVTAFYRRKRDRLDAALRDNCADTGTWQVPDVGFFLWFRPFRKTVDDLARRAAEAGVVFLPGSYFAASPSVRASDAIQGIRLAFGQIPEDQIESGIRRLAPVLGNR